MADWSSETLESICSAPIVYGIVQPGERIEDGVPYVQTRDLGSNLDASRLDRTSVEISEMYSRSQLRARDILIALRGDIGATAVVPAGLHAANISRGVARLRVGPSMSPEYVAYAISTDLVRKRLDELTSGSSLREISINSLRQVRIMAPPIAEQRKIAEILRTWDDAIESVMQLALAARSRLSAVSTVLFEGTHKQAHSLVHARDIFEPVNEKARPDLPLLAVMQDVGVVRRDSLDRRVMMPEGAVSGYKVVRPGDFVISLRSFEGGLERSNELGLVSPAYTVLRPHREVNLDYYARYFKSRSFIARLDEIVFGIRDGKQISFRDFGAMRIPAPSGVHGVEAEALNEFGRELHLLEQERDALRTQKRGLMQKLLTGEMRVGVA